MKKYLSIGLVLMFVFVGLVVVSNTFAMVSSNIATYTSNYTTSKSSYIQGQTVYMKAQNLSSDKNVYRILVKDPSATVEYTSDCSTRNTDNELRKTDPIASNAPIGTWTTELYESSGNGCNGNTSLVASSNFLVTSSDTTAPTIDNVIDIIEEATSPAGAVATFTAPMSHDVVDGDIISTCDATSGNTFPLGITTVTCSKTDEARNQAIPETFTITVVDTTAPVINLNGNNPQIIIYHNAYTESGATVSDNYDTGLTATIDASNVNADVVGSYSVYYDAVDSNGNNAIQVVRTVNVVDQENPAITLNGSDTITLKYGDTYSEQGATCADNYDESKSATVGGDNVNTSIVGTYTVTYNCTDSSNNQAEQITRTVNVERADQTINFGPLANKRSNNPDFDISATSSAGLSPITFTIDEGSMCTLIQNEESTKIHITGVGNCTVVAHQAGNENYNSAENSQTFSISRRSTSVQTEQIITIVAPVETNNEVVPVVEPVVETPPAGEVLGAEKFIFTQFMKIGLKRSEVLELQNRLTAEGFYKGLIDGKFGKDTEKAVKAYQKANPPLKIDGIVGNRTRAVLNK